MNDPLLVSNGQPISKTEARMQLLERVANVSMVKITQRMVHRMELHASKFVNAAVRMDDMVYSEQEDFLVWTTLCGQHWLQISLL
eukprot:jgi/Phyca11/132361/e_gw1.156.15.1